jgi:hypothetical protein
MSTVSYRIEVRGQDVTRWCTSLTVRQRSQHMGRREFAASFVGWHDWTPSDRWDIYGSRSGDSHSECLIRAGVVLRPPLVSIERGRAPIATAQGVDQLGLAQLRTPRETLVMVPRSESPAAALSRYTGPVGTHRVVSADTLHEALIYLLSQARLRVSLAVPEYRLAPHVIPATLSYWQAAHDLLRPFAPVIRYHRPDHRLIVGDTDLYYSGHVARLRHVVSLSSAPIPTRPVGRVTARYPRAA